MAGGGGTPTAGCGVECRSNTLGPVVSNVFIVVTASPTPSGDGGTIFCGIFEPKFVLTPVVAAAPCSMSDLNIRCRLWTIERARSEGGISETERDYCYKWYILLGFQTGLRWT